MRYGYVFNTTAWARFWPKVVQQGDCWIWIAARSRDGYGMFTCGTKDDGKQSKGYAHVVAYLWLISDIPDGLQLDHLCRSRPCCNPWHLDPVPCRVNLYRGETFLATNMAKTHCPEGHPYDEKNTRARPNGKRECKTCARARKASDVARARRRAQYVPHPAVHYQTVKTHCPKGHPYEGENLIVQKSPSGIRRMCRTCRNEQQLARYHARKKAPA